MPKHVLFVLISLAFFLLPSLGQAQRYSIREVGFVEVEAKPYRLVVFARDVKAPALQKQQASLTKELANSNIVLVAQTIDAQSVTPDKKPIGDPAVPQFWLIAPDDRAIPFQPGVMTGTLLQSPLRQKIAHEVAHSLCAIVLFESKDDDANEKARAKAETVREQINQIRKHLDRVPDGDVQLLVLPVADRARERWTLWGLGEDASATETPKIAVVFGRMRRAGALFEGTDWQEADLFKRLAALGQACENEPDRQQYLGSSLPFQWPTEWSGRFANLHFDPHTEKIKTEMTALLQQPHVPDIELTQRKLAFHDFQEAEPVPMPLPQVALDERGAMPGLIAGNDVGVLIFVIGLVGWIALGLSVLYVESRKEPAQRNANP